MSIIEDLSKKLDPQDIELRVQSIGKTGWCTVLAYKTARTDVKRMNEACGLDWECDYFYDDKKILCCSISIYSEKTKRWVKRMDVGTDSQTEAEKGSYSDAFKRAGFRWGIGIELYSLPHMFLELKESEYERKGEKGKQTYNLKIKDWSFNYEEGKVVLKDESGAVRFTQGVKFNKAPAGKPAPKKPEKKAPPKSEKKPDKEKEDLTKIMTKDDWEELKLKAVEAGFSTKEVQIEKYKEVSNVKFKEWTIKHKNHTIKKFNEIIKENGG